MDASECIPQNADVAARRTHEVLPEESADGGVDLEDGLIGWCAEVEHPIVEPRVDVDRDSLLPDMPTYVKTTQAGGAFHSHTPSSAHQHHISEYTEYLEL